MLSVEYKMNAMSVCTPENTWNENVWLRSVFNYFSYPGQELGDIGINVGQVWVVAVFMEVEWDDALDHTIAHQGASWVSLRK